MTLYVCRHGRTEANASGLLLGRADPGLDRLGQAQAAAMAGALPTPAAVLTSPLGRCRQTAAAFADRAGADGGVEIDVEVDERLVELDYGEYDLVPLRDIPPEVWRRWRADPAFRPPGGETLEELSARVSAALDEVAERATEDDVVVVSHVSPIKAALAWALGVGVEVSWRSFVAQASVTEIGFSPTGPSLRMFNGVAHLDGLDEASAS